MPARRPGTAASASAGMRSVMIGNVGGGQIGTTTVTGHGPMNRLLVLLARTAV